ncbi:DUF5403 family protein [Corynebacterium lubricantis]|uniref:DUF5403 family protein n=1 Tax=Corynebacterium lubricantis TaxID=541095 RepID=UPI00036BA520|nr:DUF5403 family protein [Corynebacterium lubricantis]
MAEIYKGVGNIVARMASDSTALDEAAEKIRASAASNASARRDTGEYSGNFKTGKQAAPKGVTDRIVYNDHPAAAHVEFGHFARGKDGRPGDWVPGQFNLTRAARGGA